jgi:GNAT superfamily N-acetyltransferase
MRAAFETPAGRVGDRVDLEFSGEIWEWRGPAPYYFVTVPEEESLDLQAISAGVTYGWGMIPVQVRIGDTDWTTSLWPKDGGYVVPLKDVVRKAEGLSEGDTITVQLIIDGPSEASRPDLRPVDPPPAQVRQPRAGRRTGESEPAVGAARPSRQVTGDQLTIVPANEASWEDLQAVFGTRGDPSRCWCQRFKMRRRESWASVGAEGLASRLREQTSCGQPESGTTSGLVAYLDGEPVGWCAVDPRPANPRLLRDCRVPWVDRTEDKTDDSIWAVTCFVTRTGFRRRGITRALARAAVDFARQRGARALEGYPDVVERGHVGSRRAFADAGFVEVTRPTSRRVVMRIDF